MGELFFILFIVLFVYYWWDSMRSKEAARLSGRAACQKHGLQFLDDTVSVSRIRFSRAATGRLQLTRHYKFEFTSDGAQRYSGRMVVLDGRVFSLEMDAYRENLPE